jgi:methylthioribose-1-phosphate isomerase
MHVDGRHYRTVWVHPEREDTVQVIDQRHLPHAFVVEDLATAEDVATAIRDMHVRGAGCIGATAGYGMYLAARQAAGSADFEAALLGAARKLIATRPTAVNLEWAVNRQLQAIAAATCLTDKITAARDTAEAIADEDADWCRRIGEHGLPLVRQIAEAKQGKPVNILTHCNAGWLAFVDYGSATAPMYAAFDACIPVHIWVDETRPRNQGARLTAWELGRHGVPHTVITDNAGGHLMQHGMVDIVLTGADRVTRTGDAANKIGTYLKALAARDTNIPFYVALPSSTFDWSMRDGLREIPVEERSADEVRFVDGAHSDGPARVLVPPASSPAANYGFDVTPGRLITGLITERGICEATEHSIITLFPEHT